jgi:predicted O-linked N-acetylglucosamine transferase (SPINDLY family)
MLNEAMRCHQDGRTARAERLYRDIIAADPNHLDAVHLTGVLAAQQKDYAKAIDYIARAARIAPHLGQIHANLGKAYYGAHRIEEARLALEEALRLQPNLADAWNDLGNALRDLGRFEQAINSFDRSVQLANHLPEPWANAADLLIDMAEFEQARSNLARALAMHPNFAEAYAIRARGALMQGQAEQALADAETALSLRPDYVDALALKGEALARLGQAEAARALLDRVLALDGQIAKRLFERGQHASTQWLRAAAIEYYDRILRLDPTNIAAHSARAIDLMLLKRLDEAAAGAARALAIDPEDGLARYVESQVAMQTCDWEGQARALAHMRGLVERGEVSVALSAFLFMCFDTTPPEQLACARISSAQMAAHAKTGVRKAARRDKIRVGYLSSDFTRHATSWLMAGLIDTHDRDRFEVIGLSNSPAVVDEMRQRLTASFDRFVDIRELPDEAAVKLIEGMELDILVDLKGYTQGHRAQVLASRPAPVQAAFLGYPGTMGADFIDYIVADRWVIPPGDEAWFDEKVVRLPDSYQVNTRRVTTPNRATRASQGLPKDGVVFCSFNSTYKITQPVFEVWMRLLQAHPDSVLWQLADNDGAIATLRREAQARGVAPERLVFAERMDQAEHLARQELADLFLDTCPVNAHTTASDALWAGLPVLTCQGPAFIGRVAASVLAAADLPELITSNLQDYEALAMALAADRTRLAAMRAKLTASRDHNRLFDTARFSRHLERAYETMQARALAGLPPEAFDVPAMDG